jgi:hypothetical protein
MPLRRLGAVLVDKRVALDLPSVRLEREPRNALGLTRRKELLS